jgi:hypothetical protein
MTDMMNVKHLEYVREQELDAYLEKIGYNDTSSCAAKFRAGFTSGVAAVVAQLKDDLRKARNTEAIARQHATDCGYPVDAIKYMRGACEARYKVEYLENLLCSLTGEEY